MGTSALHRRREGIQTGADRAINALRSDGDYEAAQQIGIDVYVQFDAAAFAWNARIIDPSAPRRRLAASTPRNFTVSSDRPRWLDTATIAEPCALRDSCGVVVIACRSRDSSSAADSRSRSDSTTLTASFSEASSNRAEA